MDPTRTLENIALIGFMGTGKSSVGQMVAGLLHFRFVDTDQMIEERAGKSIARIFAEEGEPRFREYEREVVAHLSTFRQCVIATGGGLAATEGNLDLLKKHALTICLWASPESIWRRVAHQNHRPLLQGPDPLEKIRELMAQRDPHYRKADVLINTEMRSPKEVAQQVCLQYRLARQSHAQPS
ncbi:MAG: shikimate kinase [Verrucomicrobiota bacterium]